jgi:hypothetical protein
MSQNYTFASDGTFFSFNPKKEIHLPDGKTVSNLDYHKELVRHRASCTVYLLDNRGRQVEV